MCTKGVQSDFLLHTIRVSSMKSAILKSQIDKNSFLINVNIVFFFVYVHSNSKKLFKRVNYILIYFMLN
jgi:hypothetical protein